MTGLGTIINASAIILGGIIGIIGGKFISERYRNILIKASSICVMFIGIGGAIEKMMTVDGVNLSSGGAMMTIVSFAIGSLIGEFLDIEGKIDSFGEFLKRKTGSGGDNKFVDGFVTASVTVCVGAMAVVGAINDGISGDYSILLAKSMLDFIMVMLLSSALGKGCIFSAIPVAVLQGSVTLLARFIAPHLTDAALNNLSLTGSMLIFCIGVNLVWEKKFKVANMLPTIVIAVIWAFIFK